MAHDVNQSERDVAAQVRSALVDRISSERYDLWMSENAQWFWCGSGLQISFPTEFSCQLAKRMLARDISASVMQVMGSEREVSYCVNAEVQSSDGLSRRWIKSSNACSTGGTASLRRTLSRLVGGGGNDLSKYGVHHVAVSVLCPKGCFGLQPLDAFE